MYLQTYEQLKAYIDGLEITAEHQLMVIAADKSAEYVDNLTSFCNSKNIRFFGGIFAGLLVGNKNRNEGFIVQVFKPIVSTLVLPYLMRFKLDPEKLVNATAITLVDGLSSKMKVLTDTVFGKLGKNVTYVGGGAGFYNLTHNPCIFDNNGIYKDALYLCIVESEAKLAVKHGWKKLQGPFYANKSNENILSQLENDSAFNVYKYVIEQEENLMLYKEDFFMFAKDHPFGILQEDGTVVVRDPISVNDEDEIVCVADIPEGSDVYVLNGDVDTLLNSSLQIAEYCKENAPKEYLPLLFNCISRAMFMEDRFEEELENIQSRLSCQVEGALSIGEIASKPNGELVIHNKSTILALLHK